MSHALARGPEPMEALRACLLAEEHGAAAIGGGGEVQDQDRAPGRAGLDDEVTWPEVDRGDAARP